MIQATNCFLFRDNQICLAMKKRGFGVGKWNGSGGKVHPGETVKDAAVRELQEELGVKGLDLIELGEIDFQFPHQPSWNQTVHIFVSHQWEGEPAEGEEMNPKWFSVDQIPYPEMWSDDVFWLPLVISHQKFTAQFVFNPENQVVSHQIVLSEK